MKEPRIEKVLHLSTGHLEKSDETRLKEIASFTRKEGFLVWTGMFDESQGGDAENALQMSKAFHMCLDYALIHSCEWIMFDVDEERNPHLAWRWG